MGFEKVKRPLMEGDGHFLPAPVISTAASTALEAKGVIGLVTTVASSGAPVVYTLTAPERAGQILEMVAITLVSSSAAPFHINGGSAVFSYTTASTAQDMVTLATQGAAFRAIARNTTEWMVTGIRGATFSTST